MSHPQPKIHRHATVLDTLLMARAKHPGQRNSLDALCKRYGVDASGRDVHGALIDAELLANVYLAMTGGQTKLLLEGEGDNPAASHGESLAAGQRNSYGRTPPICRSSPQTRRKSPPTRQFSTKFANPVRACGILSRLS